MKTLDLTQNDFGCRVARNSNSEYHSDLDILSSSMLKRALVSPLSFIHSITAPSPRSRAMDFGTLMHTLILEPATVDEVVAIYPEPLTRLKGCTQFKHDNRGRLVMSMAEFATLKNLADRTLDTSFRGRPFYKFVEEGVAEESIYYTDPDTGMRCRIRPDLRHPDFTFDLKTTRHYGPREFQTGALSLDYDLSAYMYSLGRVLYESQEAQEMQEAKPFVMVCVFNSAPYGTFFRPCSSAFLENGRSKYEEAMKTILACRATDYWPTTSGEIELGLEHWQQFDANAAPWKTGLEMA